MTREPFVPQRGDTEGWRWDMLRCLPGLLCLMAAIAAPLARAEPPGAELRPAEPVVCRSDEEIVLDGRRIDASGVAVSAHGRCRVTISNCRIVAKGVAFDLHGRAQVTLRDTRVEGRGVVVDLHGEARLSASGTQFKGRFSRHGRAVYHDAGGNTWDTPLERPD